MVVASGGGRGQGGVRAGFPRDVDGGQDEGAVLGAVEGRRVGEAPAAAAEAGRQRPRTGVGMLPKHVRMPRWLTVSLVTDNIEPPRVNFSVFLRLHMYQVPVCNSTCFVLSDGLYETFGTDRYPFISSITSTTVSIVVGSLSLAFVAS